MDDEHDAAENQRDRVNYKKDNIEHFLVPGRLFVVCYIEKQIL